MPAGIHLISDGGKLRREGRLIGVLAKALSGANGAIAAVHLREQPHPKQTASDEEVSELALRALEICEAHGAKLIINRRLDLATAADAHGVHLSGPVDVVGSTRALCTSNFLIGYSAHSVEEAEAACADEADYVFLSPIFDPISKQAVTAPLGLNSLSHAAALLPGKVIALGGIDADRAKECKKCGAAGIAVIGSVMLAQDPEKAAAELADAWLVGN